jgi:spore germination cell wall hydrolase CwlJ-like protein
VKKVLLILMMMTYGTASYAHHTSCNKEQQIKALALNMYHEARGEGHDGMLIVGEVTLNRVKSNKFPNSICGVVYQGRRDSKGNMVRHKCQFSWYCDGASDRVRDISMWATAQEIARGLVDGSYETFGTTATHYHATYVKPYWSKKFEVVGRIGKHIFYDMEGRS